MNFALISETSDWTFLTILSRETVEKSLSLKYLALVFSIQSKGMCHIKEMLLKHESYSCNLEVFSSEKENRIENESCKMKF